MLVFVIPLKSKQVSKSWQRVCDLFERCLRSICQQTSQEFRAIVVCHDKPDIGFHHPHVSYIEVDFATPKEEEPTARGDTDKGRKLLRGLVAAADFSPTHTMTVDADDCVSRELAAFVQAHPDANGWFVHQGYKYLEGSPFVYVKRRNFEQMCGSSNILRYDLNFLPEEPEYNRGYGYYRYHLLHARVKQVLADKQTPLAPLPFPGAVYILGHGDNISNNLYEVNFQSLTALLQRRRLTPELQAEFGLYNLSAVG